MKYFISQGPHLAPIAVELNDPPPCLYCDVPVALPSMDGPLVCSCCDMGRNPDGSRWTTDQARERREHARAKIDAYRMPVEHVN